MNDLNLQQSIETLPADLSSLVVRGSDTAQYAVTPVVPPAPAAGGVGKPGQAQQLDQNWPNGPVGVSGASSVADISPWPAVVPLSTPSPSLGHAPSTAAETAPAGPAATSAQVQGAPVKRLGRTHPKKPLTPVQIAEFSNLWNDGEFTVPQLARRYGCGERTLQTWRVELGLAPHPVLARARVAAEADAAEGKTSTPTNPKLMDPSKDPEIVEALRDIQSAARAMSAHSDIQIIQRKLSRLSILIVTKTPLRSWEQAHILIESMAKSVLNARRIEASLPPGDVDQVALRKEAASQMMRELKGVLTPAEQAVLAKVMQAGVDRLIAKGPQTSVPNDLPGAPGSYAHNGKHRPQ